ncbi:MAG: AAA family ATPase [Chloroflexi bacterium]|nr:AAA family ATPase [Chloroflexota bacterium]
MLFIVGPPAVGKMTVGAEVAKRTGLKLFHNHQTIDLVLNYFPFGSRPFGRLVSEFRRRICEEVADSDLPGLIFTYVWAFDQPADDAEVETYSAIFRSRGGSVMHVELQARQEIRLQRNETDFRLAQKAPKRDIAFSRQNLIDMDARYQLDSGDRFVGRDDYWRIDNSELAADRVAEMIIERFGLPVVLP